jgi:hypothetical protein
MDWEEKIMNITKGEIKRGVDTCLDCIKACEKCAIYGLAYPGLQECVKLAQECANICLIFAQFIQKDSDFSLQLCSICADLCYVCAAECDKHTENESCLECARASRRCGDLCRKLISTHFGLYQRTA